MRRLRQMVETISERLRAQDVRERTFATWQTSTLAQFTAGYGGKDFVAAAREVSLLKKHEKAESPSHLEPGMNSTEALMAFAGGLMRGSA